MKKTKIILILITIAYLIFNFLPFIQKMRIHSLLSNGDRTYNVEDKEMIELDIIKIKEKKIYIPQYESKMNRIYYYIVEDRWFFGFKFYRLRGKIIGECNCKFTGPDLKNGSTIITTFEDDVKTVQFVFPSGKVDNINVINKSYLVYYYDFKEGYPKVNFIKD